MELRKGEKYLVTTNDWFIAPDGGQYRAVWGTVNGLVDSEKVLGIKTNRNATNWFLSVGNMIVAGCQIHYAIKVDTVNLGSAIDEQMDASNYHKFDRRSWIYNADK